MSIQNAAQEITITVDGKTYAGWIMQVSKSSWRASCMIDDKPLDATGSSRSAVMELLRWQASNHDS